MSQENVEVVRRVFEYTGSGEDLPFESYATDRRIQNMPESRSGGRITGMRDWRGGGPISPR
jgi:hypothetical protein